MSGRNISTSLCFTLICEFIKAPSGAYFFALLISHHTHMRTNAVKTWYTILPFHIFGCARASPLSVSCIIHRPLATHFGRVRGKETIIGPPSRPPTLTAIGPTLKADTTPRTAPTLTNLSRNPNDSPAVGTPPAGIVTAYPASNPGRCLNENQGR